MNPLLIALILYLAVVNVAAGLLTARDKRNARRGLYRVPESHLLFLAAIGGALGEWIAMYATHHKTKKPRFVIGVPALLLAHLVCLALLFRGGAL